MLRRTTRSLARRKFRAIALPDDIDSITSIDERNEVNPEQSGLSDEARDSHYAYGHLGLSNVFCWADPERDISVSLLTSGKPVLGTHLAALPRLLFSIAKQCPRTRNMESANLPAPL